MLAYRPFLDPLPLHDLWWVTIIPLALGISAAYKAVRIPDADLATPRYLRHVFSMTTQAIGAMLGIWVGLVLLIEFIVPLFG